MAYLYPIFLDLESKTCLVVGAGPVGARKAAGALEAGAMVRLVAMHIGDAALGIMQNRQVELLQEPYRTAHLDSVSLAFAATNDRSINARIVEDARNRNIPVNCADSPGESVSESDSDTFTNTNTNSNTGGEFIVPALMRRGELSIAVSTGGASPKLAQKIRNEIEAVYSVEYAEYVELLREMRSYIKGRVHDSDLRSAALESLIANESESALRLLLRDAGIVRARDEARRIVEAALPVPLE
jgi:precorrin-2 dehydrogenase/sirohydrochlorin ferrochelatase